MIPQESAGWELPDWQRQQADLITDPAELLALLELDAAELPGSLAAAQDFPLRVPRRYVDLIEKRNPRDPLLRQVLSVSAELEVAPGYGADPLEEGDHTPVPGLLHKYQGRALLVVTGACAVHCRYCFRRHFPYQSHLSGKRWEQALAWLAARPDINEVILSGGDPLTLTNRRIQQLLDTTISQGQRVSPTQDDLVDVRTGGQPGQRLLPALAAQMTLIGEMAAKTVATMHRAGTGHHQQGTPLILV